jgi:hypothetical protein
VEGNTKHKSIWASEEMKAKTKRFRLKNKKGKRKEIVLKGYSMTVTKK